MPDSLHIRVGETRQLRPPPEGVGRWTSSAPTVVTTTDENLVTNKSGGLITAIKTGQAKIIAYGYDNKTKVMELDIEVELGRDTATIRVAKNETADLPQTAGLTRWTITNPRVAEMMGDNRVRGISPGITSARGEGNDAVECAIEVTGSIDVGVGQSVRLAELFAPPVKAWRTSCPTEVEIDARGTVTTGDRARTVEVSVELVSGRVFTFNLRIMGASSSRPSPQIRTVAIESERIASPSTVSETILPGVSPTPQPGQQQMVEALIAEAEVHMVADDWMQERTLLMPPPRPFDGFVEHTKRVSPTCLVTFERVRYSVPASFANRPVSLRVYAERIVVAAEGQLLCEHRRVIDRRHDSVGHTVYDWRHYLAVLQRKPGALRNGAPFVELPAAFRQLQAALLKQPGGDREMVEVLALVLHHDEQAVLTAVELALEAGVPTKMHVLNVLHRLLDSKAPPPPVTAPQALRLVREPLANVTRYDDLRASERKVRHAS